MAFSPGGRSGDYKKAPLHNYIMDSTKTIRENAIAICDFSFFSTSGREKREVKSRAMLEDKTDRSTEKQSGLRHDSIYFYPRTQEKLKQDDEFVANLCLRSHLA